MRGRNEGGGTIAPTPVQTPLQRDHTSGKLAASDLTRGFHEGACKTQSLESNITFENVKALAVGLTRGLRNASVMPTKHLQDEGITKNLGLGLLDLTRWPRSLLCRDGRS